ncbi:uncharacterized protein LOC131285294 [Anopheles ziemanni]|uniref:uncharacterized protein LOC131271538 n=1 Tax=Anopheles coustani TaxID=139045 RepID=UPI0026592643|nr:uncharacterized protein LOC131271538 [Anopheles coustani]XP_058170131.1 uncharacterized protein LOC131285294 [Anopheles ziemanni]
MESREDEPLAPTKPPEIDPELNATAATAVEQWRNYQQAYAAYQQQYAAYQQYIQQRQYAQTVEQQQMAYSQYLERHSQYQYQLQQYEQHHQQLPPTDAVASWSGESYGVPNPMMVQQPVMAAVEPNASQMNGYSVMPTRQDALAEQSAFAKTRKRPREPRSKIRSNEKKSELHTKTIVYVNPDDETMLPADLKKLFMEFQCDLCRTRMNSHISANIHYQSKAHEKKINQWLKEYCAATGTPMPVRVRRQPELATEAIAAVGQSVYHCEACDLPLTSIQHANQHYTGKRHWMVVNGKKLPSGNGFYNAEGKWIRSGNIVTEQTDPVPNGANKRPAHPVVQIKAKRRLLEPPPVPPTELMTGVNWLADAVPTSSINGVTTQPTPVPEVSTAVPTLVISVTPFNEPKPILTINVESDEEEPKTVVPPVVETTIVGAPAVAVPGQVVVTAPPEGGPNTSITTSAPTTTLEQEIRKKEGLDCVDDSGTFCLICETSVTSRSEMLMHMKGAKHLKKARLKGLAVRTTPFRPGDTILKSLSRPARKTDWSLYRMPSGKFYCKLCNLIVADEKMFSMHWYGKKHKLKKRQEQASEQNGNATTTTTTTMATTSVPSTPVNPFASDDIELAPAAYDPPVEAVDANLHQIDQALPPFKRHFRAFYYGKRNRFGKPRKPFPVSN